mmetsp:Transcript_12275/g.26474  ORF Transcript_12275/g.26474 Transcript_12275/m.26474 type:complete len:110 (-) Transcript_12275:2300-2629(-)
MHAWSMTSLQHVFHCSFTSKQPPLFTAPTAVSTFNLIQAPRHTLSGQSVNCQQAKSSSADPEADSFHQLSNQTFITRPSITTTFWQAYHDPCKHAHFTNHAAYQQQANQ